MKSGERVVELQEWLILAPDEKWTLQEHEARSGNSSRSTRAEYGVDVDGFPTLKRVVMKNGRGTTTFEFTDFRFAPSPAKDFTPASAGVPDLEEPAAPRRNNSAS